MTKAHRALTGVHLAHRHKNYDLFVREDGGLELYVDQCLRKRRAPGEREPQYVWTNIELEWEEHHYIEARYWASQDMLTVTVNKDEVFSGQPGARDVENWLVADPPPQD